MNLSEALQFTGDQFGAIMADSEAPKPWLAPLEDEDSGSGNNRRWVAVYDRGGAQAKPLGVLIWEDLALALAAGRNMKMFDSGVMDGNGDLRENLKAGVSDEKRAKLEARKAELEAKVAEIDKRLA